MKFISDQEGIMNRYLREKENWKAHLKNTREFIIDSFKNPSVKTIALLGSGWLLDVPLEKLSKRFEKILLVDIHHPPQIRKKVAQYRNVEVLETDITGGGIKFIWDIKTRLQEKIDAAYPLSFKPSALELSFEPDAFISLNILNQLDILLIDYLKEKNSRITEDDYHDFRKTIQDFHLDWISGKPGCLISDVEEENINKNGISTKHKLIHSDLPKHFRSKQWTWDFDLSGNYHRQLQTKMKVQAIEW